MQPPADLTSLFAFDDRSADARPALRLRLGAERYHRDVTYGELRMLAQSAGAELLEAGCRAGDRVAVLLPHSERLIATFFGALYIGAVPAIVAWPTTKMDPDKYARNLAAVLHSLHADLLVTEASRHLHRDASGATRVLEVSAAERPRPGTCAAEPRSQGMAFIQFSGGTTGSQKSVPIGYATLSRQLASYASALRLREGDRVISWLPLYHDMGLIASLLLPFVFRLPVSVFSPMEWVMDPRPFLRSVGKDRATLCWLPNFAFSFMATRFRFEPGSLDLSPLRAVTNCSERVRAESMDAFRDAFHPHGLPSSAPRTCYAMAEATFAVTQSTDVDPPLRVQVDAAALGRSRIERVPTEGRPLLSCGRPIQGVDVRITDSAGNDCAEGSIGEIRLRGPFVLERYLDADRPAAFEDGWYRTGDLGAWLDGHLFVTGRIKDLIIVGGVNVYPEDIEAAVSQISGIHAGRVAAVSLEDDAMGTERLVVVAEVEHDEDLARRDALEAEVRRTVLAVTGLAPFRVFVLPKQWVVKSTAGKVSRTETKARLLARWNELNSTPIATS
jgi:acyl-CoA synthetase (AMP-forming)/AMP-acid ligase II